MGAPPGITQTDDPKYAEVIASYVGHLINTKGYSCIQYFILVNEPNYEAGDFERWARGVRNIARAFAENGLGKQVAIAGPDHSNADEWLFKAVDQLGDVLGAYDVHRYATGQNVAPGKLRDYFTRQWQYARQNGPAATGKAGLVLDRGSLLRYPVTGWERYLERRSDDSSRAHFVSLPGGDA